jgi:hypothetical protein
VVVLKAPRTHHGGVSIVQEVADGGWPTHLAFFPSYHEVGCPTLRRFCGGWAARKAGKLGLGGLLLLASYRMGGSAIQRAKGGAEGH